jgi:hypothetical protein
MGTAGSEGSPAAKNMALGLVTAAAVQNVHKLIERWKLRNGHELIERWKHRNGRELIERWKLRMILAFRLMPFRCRRWGRPCKSGGPPLFALSLKIQRDTHNPAPVRLTRTALQSS